MSDYVGIYTHGWFDSTGTNPTQVQVFTHGWFESLSTDVSGGVLDVVTFVTRGATAVTYVTRGALTYEMVTRGD